MAFLGKLCMLLLGFMNSSRVFPWAVGEGTRASLGEQIVFGNKLLEDNGASAVWP